MIASPCPDGSLLDRLRLHAQNCPNRLVYTFLRDNQEADTLTFGQLDQRVRGLAARLREHVACGDRALLLYPPGLAFIEAFLICLAAGIIPQTRPEWSPQARDAEGVMPRFRFCNP